MDDNSLISAKVIEDSITLYKQRLISIELTSPKFIDAEFEKHRMISSNSSSSRAIPFKRTLNRPMFLSTDLRYNEKGMQGHKQADDIDSAYFSALAIELFEKTVDTCKVMDKEIDIHKQHINRYLEPWTIQKKVATAHIDEWEYFLGLRDHEAADPNIQDLARKIRIAISESKSNKLTNEGWHLPYVTQEEKLEGLMQENISHSVARCARVSYDNFSGNLSSVEEDFRLASFLGKAKHLSCFEHTAQGTIAYVDVGSDKSFYEIFNSLPVGVTHVNRNGKVYSGNFHGFIQYRQLLV